MKYGVELAIILISAVLQLMFGVLYIDRPTCHAYDSSDLLQLPIWLIVKGVLEMNLTVLFISYSIERCNAFGIAYLWFLSLVYLVWVFIGVYLYWIQCLTAYSIEASTFMGCCLALGFVVANLNFKITNYLDNKRHLPANPLSYSDSYNYFPFNREDDTVMYSSSYRRQNDDSV